MNYYINITLLPNSELPATVLMNLLYAKLHKALHDLKSTNIGVSFPKYEVTLGNVLRIHGDRSVINDLQGLNWIGGMHGYCSVSELKPVPDITMFRTVSRKQPTMSSAKMRRLLKRGSLREEEVNAYKVKMFSKGLENPYLELVSGSNGHKHRRYIEFGDLLSESVSGEFDQFGLSKVATVPWF